MECKQGSQVRLPWPFKDAYRKMKLLSLGPGVPKAGEGQEERGAELMGQTREDPRRVREEWEEALGRGLRPSIMSPLFLGSVDFANCKWCWQG